MGPTDVEVSSPEPGFRTQVYVKAGDSSVWVELPPLLGTLTKPSTRHCSGRGGSPSTFTPVGRSVGGGGGAGRGGYLSTRTGPVRATVTDTRGTVPGVAGQDEKKFRGTFLHRSKFDP